MGGGLFDWLRGANRRRIARRRLARPPVPTPFGFRFNGLAAMQQGSFEPFETALVRRLLDRADRFVNVGANTGYYCCFAQQVGVPTVALEPVAPNVQMLIGNMRANGWGDGITVLPVAAGEHPGFAEIFGVGTGSSLLPGWAGNPESLSQTVPVVRLDDVVPPPAAGERLLVLMDVEGYEYFALRGASALLESQPRPLWLIEIAAEGAGGAASGHVAETFAMMAAAGYAAAAVREGLDPVTGPVPGVTNYLFHDAGLAPDAVFAETPR
jgi:FkbM family methyltransferase